MSSVTPVPELAATGVRLTARDAWVTVRRCGLRSLARESYLRFRYGDGFSHARALGLQFTITTIPLVIATVGLANALGTESVGLLLRRTLLELTPGASDELLRTTLTFRDDVDNHVLALVLGLLAALVALSTAMGELERGANRIYGIRRDPPALVKYRRAFGLALTAGLPAMAGSAVLVAAEAFAESVELLLGLDDDPVVLVVRALGVLLLLAAITLMLQRAPDRRQPGWSLLALGALFALVLWVALTAMLAGFLHLAADIGSLYGPLTGVMALLLWAQLTSVAILLGLAVSAQIESARVGRRDAAEIVERPLPQAQDLEQIAVLEHETKNDEEKT